MQARRKLIEIAGMSGPAHEAWLSEFLQAEAVRYAGLRGIGRDDFEIVFFSEGKKSVACPAAGMDTAEGGADAGVLFDERDAAIEVVAAEENVVENCRHFNGSPREARRSERAGCQREKSAAWEFRRHAAPEVLRAAWYHARSFEES